MIKAPLSIVVSNRQPPVAYQYQQHVARLRRVPDYLGEVIARLYGVDVLEDLSFTEVRYEPIEQRGGWKFCILASITHENPAKGGRNR
jgi:hypothetical protein